MSLSITAFYAVIFTIIVIILANIVSAHRARAQVSILHGDDMLLALWIRRHGNLVENVALALILMGLAELRGLPPVWLHAMGIILLVSRAIHLIGLSVTNLKSPLRIGGGVGTQVAMLIAVIYLGWSLVQIGL